MPTKKLCMIQTVKEIPELGGIMGPITRPTWIKADIISSLVTRGVKVVEVNPANKKETLVLTRLNFNKVNFSAVNIVVHNDEKVIDRTVEAAPVVMSETPVAQTKKEKAVEVKEAEKVSVPDTFEA